MTSPATQARGGPVPRWSCETIVWALRVYVDTYGESELSAASFSPSQARWRDRPELFERYYKGMPDGSPWPSLNSIKGHFGGSFDAAVRAAGFEPKRPGPASRRAPHTHEPIRDGSMPGATRTIYVERKADPAELNELRAELRAAERRAEKAEGLADDVGALKRARNQRDAAREALSAARKALRSAKGTVRSSQRVAEALAADLARERARRIAAEDAAGRSRTVEVPVTVETVRERIIEKPVDRVRIERVEVFRDPPETEEMNAALSRAIEADRRAAAAEREAAAASERYAELAEAVRGNRRRLTAAELSELRRSGPAGPALLGMALKELARARAGRSDMKQALTEVASAAISWRDRIR